MTARAAYKELKRLREGVNPLAFAVPPTWSSADRQLLCSWRAIVEWEMKNPLHLDNPERIKRRIVHSFRVALLSLRFYPEVW